MAGLGLVDVSARKKRAKETSKENGQDDYPYLRPMSSMTDEEFTQYDKTLDWRYVGDGCERLDTLETFDWLNEHHFDYRGLIEKDLALEAKEGMYKTE